MSTIGQAAAMNVAGTHKEESVETINTLLEKAAAAIEKESTGHAKKLADQIVALVDPSHGPSVLVLLVAVKQAYSRLRIWLVDGAQFKPGVLEQFIAEAKDATKTEDKPKES